ncbi:MAG: T9SS type A sorting domain-containing protein [Bacteroidales bacterium]|nr:T9SS type A sorting domain-containing protein [Bacteroidales bacterium]MCF8402462.1 T9SS type A sorting domain-containing protein [Bacteroidales bacterium]
MKRISLICLLGIFFLQAFSQNFECIKTDATYYFSESDINFTGEQSYHAIQIDSITINEDTTSYYQFPVIGIENGQWECYSGSWPSWIGKRIDVLDDGTTLFYDLYDGPVFIKPQADVGDEWVCFNFITGAIYKAQLESLTQMNFLGITDMVKKITFQAYGCNGEPMIHPINDKYILISENHGLIQTLNFKVFPDLIDNFLEDEIMEYELVGISEPEIGIQNLSIEKIFDYEVGDEFHTYQDALMWGDNYYFKTIHEVIGKQYVNETLIEYTFKRCGRLHYEYLGSGYDTIHFQNDTLIIQMDFNAYSDPALNDVPDKYFKEGNPEYYEYRWYKQQYDSEMNKVRKNLYDGFISVAPHDCIEPIITDEKYYSNSYYLEGLGGPFWEYGDFGYEYHKYLVYYKKGTEEWGEPYNCDSLLVSTTDLPVSKLVISIAPNPMKNLSKIKTQSQGLKNSVISIFNSTGIKLMEFKDSPEVVLNKGDLNPGIYLVQFYLNGLLTDTKKLIVQ